MIYQVQPVFIQKASQSSYTHWKCHIFPFQEGHPSSRNMGFQGPKISLPEGQEEDAARLLPAIPATQEAEIRRMMVRSQPRKIAHETLSQKTPS
jgi:hypothetical protein